MENNLITILTEIEVIIGKIGNFDIGNSQLSDQGRKELTDLFRKKIIIAKSLHEKSALKLVI